MATWCCHYNRSMADLQLHWDELSADEIARLLRPARNSAGTLATPFLDCHQWIPLVRQQGWTAEGGFQNAQFRSVHIENQLPRISYWLLPADAVQRQAKTARSASRLLRRTLSPGSLGDLYSSTDGYLLAALSLATPALLELGAKQLASAPETPHTAHRATAASLRLDAVVARIFHVSREEAQRAIDYGFVFVNFNSADKRSLSIRPGDQIVFRTKGRALIGSAGLNERSKRQWLEYVPFLV